MSFEKVIPQTLLCIAKMHTYVYISALTLDMTLNLLKNHIFQYTETPPISQKPDNIRGFPNISLIYCFNQK